jgi:hypothetical protein
VCDLLHGDQQQHGLKLPDWLSQEQYYTLLRLSVFGLSKAFEGIGLNRLTAGVFLHRILTDMQKKRNGSEDLQKTKLLVYSVVRQLLMKSYNVTVIIHCGSMMEPSTPC